jgi:hypothetical protein
MTDLETEIESPTPIASEPKKKRVRGDALKRLTKATARYVRHNSDELAKALFTRALEGDVSCTKLLVSLIEKAPPPKTDFRSIALEWANSPAWKDPHDEADDDGENLEARVEGESTAVR